MTDQVQLLASEAEVAAPLVGYSKRGTLVLTEQAVSLIERNQEVLRIPLDSIHQVKQGFMHLVITYEDPVTNAEATKALRFTPRPLKWIPIVSDLARFVVLVARFSEYNKLPTTWIEAIEAARGRSTPTS